MKILEILLGIKNRCGGYVLSFDHEYKTVIDKDIL